MDGETQNHGSKEDKTRSGRTACPAGIRTFNQEGNVVRLACDQWRCDSCRQVLSRRCARRVRYGIALWPGDAYLWTFTMRGYVKTPHLAFHVLRVGWDTLRKRVQRYYGEFQYAAFVEIHPKRKGIAHVHAVSLCPSPQRIKDLAYRSGFGFMATEQIIEGVEAAFYVAKYTTKQGHEMPSGFRRVRFSTGWPALPDPIYDTECYPMQKGEGLGHYLSRVRTLTHVGADRLAYNWFHPELDL